MGAELAPLVVGLAQWASRSPAMRYDAPLGTDSLMLSLKALFDRPAADLEATIAVHLGDERFQIRIAGGELTISRGKIDDPDATLETDQATLLGLLRTDRPLDEAIARGTCASSGTAASWRGSGAYFHSRSQYRSPAARKYPPGGPPGDTGSIIAFRRVTVRHQLQQSWTARPARVDHRPATQCRRNVQLSKLGI